MAATPIEQLLAVQELDLRIREMERELHDLPVRKKMEEGRLAEHRQNVVKAEDAIKAVQAELKKLELDALSGNEKISKLRSQQLQLKTNKEFTTMESEIATVRRGISGQEDQELVLMEKLEAARSALAEQKKALAVEEQAVKADMSVFDERAGRVNAELASVRAERAERAKLTIAGWLARYDTIASRKGNAIVRVEGGICGGCHMALPPSVIHESARRTAMVFCNFCGRMLY